MSARASACQHRVSTTSTGAALATSRMHRPPRYCTAPSNQAWYPHSKVGLSYRSLFLFTKVVCVGGQMQQWRETSRCVLVCRCVVAAAG